MLANKKAISTLILIILLLCSAIFGAIISYLWVMGSYYNMPEETTMLIVENVLFPTNDARYFNVTILNPSNSLSDVNITAIRVTVENRKETIDVTETEPEPLPFLIAKGTRQTFKCKKNWSTFAGENVTIEPVTPNASTKSYLYTTPNVKLNLTPVFDVTESVEYFNLTIENAANSIINLTISDVKVNFESIKGNLTPPLVSPYVLSPGQSETFRCNWNWDWQKIGKINVTVSVETEEGFECSITTDEVKGAILDITDIVFDYTDTSYFNLTVRSSEYSTATAFLNMINLTLPDQTTITLETSPPLNVIPVALPKNESLTIKCFWNWASIRKENVTVSVYTKQGFAAPTKTFETPPPVVWNITDVKFDLDDVKHFLVNVTNMPCSLQSITITKILIDENETLITPSQAVIANGTCALINCTFPWESLKGKSAFITVITEEGLSIVRHVTVPSVEIKLLGETLIFGDLRDIYPEMAFSIPYLNVTVSNSNNSLQNVTITRIVLQRENATYEIDGAISYPQFAPNGCKLNIGETITVICLFNWNAYLLEGTVTVTVFTAEGFQTSRTWQISLP
ncbi:MAG: hypothetical protein QXM86_00265 [Candidatus Bathyarchaeia archaeon]